MTDLWNNIRNNEATQKNPVTSVIKQTSFNACLRSRRGNSSKKQ